MIPFLLLFDKRLLCFLFFSNLLTTNAQPPSRAALDSLITAAKLTHSDGLVLLQDGKVVVEEYFGNPVTPTYIASISKALTGTAILKLLNDKKIKSIDQPVADFYPEWKQGQKRDITLRMLLSHTSGMQNIANTRLEIETGPKGSGDDLVKLALAAEITDKPGTVYSYNNKATCLLPGIIEVASGKRMDAYFEQEFFRPLGISQFEWKRDGTGRPQGHGGFQLMPMDLARFGQLMLEGGSYGGHSFFEPRWADSALRPSQKLNPEIGLLWFLAKDRSGPFRLNTDLLKTLEAAHPNNPILQGLAGLAAQAFAGEHDLAPALEKALGVGWMPKLTTLLTTEKKTPLDLFPAAETSDRLSGFYHIGSWGNYLVVVPSLRLVAVRVVKRDKDYMEATDKFGDFVRRVLSLAKP